MSYSLYIVPLGPCICLNVDWFDEAVELVLLTEGVWKREFPAKLFSLALPLLLSAIPSRGCLLGDMPLAGYGFGNDELLLIYCCKKLFVIILP